MNSEASGARVNIKRTEPTLGNGFHDGRHTDCNRCDVYMILHRIATEHVMAQAVGNLSVDH